MKKLGFGCMRLPLLDPEDATKIDEQQVCEMFDEFLKNGFTYIDTAYPYHSGESERVVKRCLTSRYPRDSYTLATKLPTFNLEKPEDCERFFEEQLEKTGVDYFDYYLIHCLNERLYKVAKECKAFEFVSRKKEEGKAKEIGFSFHDTPELLDEILTAHPEVDFVQLQINYLDWEADNVQSRACYEVARKHGKKVIIMEPIKGGKLVNVDEDIKEQLKEMDPNMSTASWAVRFAASLDGVFMVLSGMSNLEQMKDNLSYMKDFKPLNEEEFNKVLDCGDQIRKKVVVPCTGCQYCTDGCPMNICIPEYFDLYNQRAKDLSVGKSDKYNALSEEHGKASDCIACGQCESMCPQHIHIIDHLKNIAESFE